MSNPGEPELRDWHFRQLKWTLQALAPGQVEALSAIGRQLATMSKDGVEFDPELWTDAGLRAREQWKQVRALAAAALEAFGWPVESPPLDPADRDTRFVP